MNEGIRVLHVDDDPSFLDLTKTSLERDRDGFEIVTTTDTSEGMARLETGSFDCIVSDHEMPRRDGIDFLRIVRERHPDLPFILFTGHGSEDNASEAMSEGVTDYLSKDGPERFSLLANRIASAVEMSRSRTALHERTRRLEMLIDTLPGVVYCCRNAPGWPMELFEGEGEALCGYPPAAFEERDLLWGEDVIHPEDRAAVWEAVQAGLEEEGRFELSYRIITADDEVRWVWERGAGVYADDGTLEVLEGFITDVTERVDRERELERYETIVETSGDAVYTLDADGRFTFINETLVSVTGHPEERFLGSEPFFIMDEEHIERGERLIRALLKSDEDRGTFEMDLITADGERIPCENHLVLLPSDDEFRGTAGILRDITRRKERASELQRQNERLYEFAGIVSHDLRNPLNVAIGRVELAREACDNVHLEAVEEAHERMERLIEDTLTLARRGQTISLAEPVDIAPLVEGCWAMVDATEATLHFDEPFTIECDPDALQQLFENLFRNAIEHVGPTATVRVGRVGDDAFYVEDDGPGIPEEIRERIFEPAFSTADQGTGFGLAIVEEIANAHGWHIRATESDAGGARFEVSGVRFERDDAGDP